MPRHNFRPWVWFAAVVVVAGAVGYPYYFDWWDHKNCRDSGGTWNEAQGACIEPKNARFEASGSPHFEDDNQAGDKPAR
jgi:hypothetical protein